MPTDTLAAEVVTVAGGGLLAAVLAVYLAMLLAKYPLATSSVGATFLVIWSVSHNE